MSAMMTTSLIPELTAGDVHVIEKTSPFEGYFRVDRYRLKHRLFEGGWTAEMDREVFERGHIVAVLLYDPELDRVVLIEQFRPGAYAALASEWFSDDASPWLVECVAGIIEKGEDPVGVARREAIEETGCKITDVLPICHYLASPGATSESVFVFCGRTAASNAAGVHGLSEEGENIRVFSLAASEAFEMLEQGRFLNAWTIIALQWLRANHSSVRNGWQAMGSP